MSQIRANAQQLAGWTDDLSELSYLEAHVGDFFRVFKSSTLQIKDIVERVLSEETEIRKRLETLGKQLVIHVPTLGPIKGDELRLTKALRCLLNDLCDFTVRGGVVTINATQAKNRWNSFNADAIHVVVTDFIKDVPQNRWLPFGYEYDKRLGAMGMDLRLAKVILEAHWPSLGRKYQGRSTCIPFHVAGRRLIRWADIPITTHASALVHSRDS